MVSQAKLKILQEKLNTVKVLREAYDYFFDHFGENPSFMKLGHPTHNPEILILVKDICAKFLFTSQKVEIQQKRLIRVRKYGIVHGTCIINNCLIAMFYFEKMEKGLMSIYSGGKTTIVRITKNPKNNEFSGKIAKFNFN